MKDSYQDGGGKYAIFERLVSIPAGKKATGAGKNRWERKISPPKTEVRRGGLKRRNLTGLCTQWSNHIKGVERKGSTKGNKRVGRGLCIF